MQKLINRLPHVLLVLFTWYALPLCASQVRQLADKMIEDKTRWAIEPYHLERSQSALSMQKREKRMQQYAKSRNEHLEEFSEKMQKICSDNEIDAAFLPALEYVIEQAKTAVSYGVHNEQFLVVDENGYLSLLDLKRWKRELFVRPLVKAITESSDRQFLILHEKDGYFATLLSRKGDKLPGCLNKVFIQPKDVFPSSNGKYIYVIAENGNTQIFDLTTGCLIAQSLVPFIKLCQNYESECKKYVVEERYSMSKRWHLRFKMIDNHALQQLSECSSEQFSFMKKLYDQRREELAAQSQQKPYVPKKISLDDNQQVIYKQLYKEHPFFAMALWQYYGESDVYKIYGEESEKSEGWEWPESDKPCAVPEGLRELTDAATDALNKSIQQSYSAPSIASQTLTCETNLSTALDKSQNAERWSATSLKETFIQ